MNERRGGQLEGIVQGVGFRPFVARLARELSLSGFVRNIGAAVELEVEGPGAALEAFRRRLEAELPPAARVRRARWRALAPRDDAGFVIERSEAGHPAAMPIPPDLRVCDECLAEVADPDARRHRYPFTNCTRCGPRFTIVDTLPWDRARTGMADFELCPACAREYADEQDRRYHAEPIACPDCGPRLTALEPDGSTAARDDAALRLAADALSRGEIVALKGIGGYQLLVDATDEAAVQRLRERKHRPFRPLAVMITDLAQARLLAHVDAVEAAALTSPAGPIVLLRARNGGLAPSVAPALRQLGLMLPTTPLHALLLGDVGRPLVATSGNRHGAPICIDDEEAVRQLGPIADLLLVHDRPIRRRCDDAVVQVVLGQPRTLRLGRGLAPLELPMPGLNAPTLALGGHLKHAAGVGARGAATLWCHVGDLDALEAVEAMEEALQDATRLTGDTPARLVVDAHPDLAPSRWAERRPEPRVLATHHHAHVAAVMAEHGVEAALGVAFDGFGRGEDGGAWGGEWLAVDRSGAVRVGHLRPFPLPGGADAAARQAPRVLAGLLHEAGIEPPADLRETLAPLLELAAHPRLAPPTTSAGRLFDAAAMLAGCGARNRSEGELAMRLQAMARPGERPYPVDARLGPAGVEVDWRPALEAMLGDRRDPQRLASRFHATLAAMIEAVVAHLEPEPGVRPVVLSGGCFANRLLCTLTHGRLTARGHDVRLPRRVPPGDGGLALGQLWIAAGLDRAQASEEATS